MDWFLVITAVVISFVLLAFSTMILIYYGHPDDSNSAWFPRIVVVFCLYLTCANVLLLPLDVASSQSGGGLMMSVAWNIAIWVTAIMLFVVIPFAYFYYENEQLEDADLTGCCGLIPNWNGQMCEGIKWSLGSSICFGLLLTIMWLFLRWTDIPVKTRAYNWDSNHRTIVGASIPSALDCSDACESDTLKMKIEVTIGVFLMAMLAFLGWFLFVVFGGMGLVMLPWDLYSSWSSRPAPMSLEEYAIKKKEYRERATLLKSAGHAIKNDELYNQAQSKRPSRSDRLEMAETLHRFENAVYMLKKEFIHTQASYNLRGGNPFIPYLKLICAIVGGSMSLMWIVHVCVFVLPPQPADPLLNNLFIALSFPGFSLMGVVAFGLYVGWLLFAVMKGNFRVGLRIACCRVFPMEFNGTMTNSFLFNCWLLLICSFVVVQFSAISFPIYARNSTVDLIFGTQARYLRFFTYFFDNNVFVYAFLGFAFLGVFWQLLCPRDQAAEIEKALEEVLKKKKVGRRELELAAKK